MMHLKTPGNSAKELSSPIYSQDKSGMKGSAFTSSAYAIRIRKREDLSANTRLGLKGEIISTRTWILPEMILHEQKIIFF